MITALVKTWIATDVAKESRESADGAVPTGHLVLVVGPSGAGKDSVIDGLRSVFDGHPRVYFPTRVITRPADAGGEVHTSADDDRFERQREEGAFLLSWHAHGHAYGIPIAALHRLNAGHCVICNVSRTVIEIARSDIPNTHVMLVTASRTTLRSRIEARGRESAEDTERRLQRASHFFLSGAHVREVCNDGALEDAVRDARQFVSGLL